jgi:hypothetical protein
MIELLLGNWQRIVIYGLVILMALGTAAGLGYHRGVKKLWDYQVEQAKAAVKIITKIEKVKEIVREVHVKREIEIREVVTIIEKEAPHVPVRAACNITAGWMRFHDYGAAGEDRPLDGAVDDARDTGIDEARAVRVVTENYVRFHQVANDLRACRSFVRGIVQVTSEAPE